MSNAHPLCGPVETGIQGTRDMTELCSVMVLNSEKNIVWNKIEEIGIRGFKGRDSGELDRKARG